MLELCNTTDERKRYWNGKSVLVTGATGMMGSWITHVLVAAGAHVTVLVRDWATGSLLYEGDAVKHVNIVYGSLGDFETLERIFSDYEPSFVFHMGAQTQVRAAYRNPKETFESNVLGTWNVLEAARRCDTPPGIIVASSDKAYGSQEKLPYTEETPLEGEYPYDVSKSCTDLIAQSYVHTYKLPLCITRCGNLYGPGDLNYDRLIPGTIKSILLGETPIIRSDGTYVRDYIFTPDAVDGVLTIAENFGQVVGEAFNLSTGNKLTVLDLFTTILKLLGSDAKPKILNEATAEIKEQYLSSEKAKTLLHWQPRHALQESLQITIDWYKEQLN
ncbi:MAG: GDP-mannose 4,6-dehydratase [Candidatus Woesearchaeota archaeon]|nr:GDP-mannose 4,6-dehydratase [Candidatus Woesearchaeota archaeon]